MSGDWKELEAIAKEKMGFFKKRVAENVRNEAASLNIHGELNGLIAERNKAIGEIGDALQMVLTDNKQLRRALIASLKWKPPERQEPELSLADAEKGIPMPEKEVAEKAWAKWQDEHEDQYLLAGTSRSEALRDFSSQYARGHVSKWSKGKQGGIISRVMQDLFFSQAMADMFNLK